MISSHRSYEHHRKSLERRFPHHVDIMVPPFGLGRLLNDMLDWCHQNVECGQWAQHGHSEPRGRGVVPRDFARFCFLDEAKAEAFRQRWCS